MLNIHSKRFSFSLSLSLLQQSKFMKNYILIEGDKLSYYLDFKNNKAREFIITDFCAVI